MTRAAVPTSTPKHRWPAGAVLLTVVSLALVLASAAQARSGAIVATATTPDGRSVSLRAADSAHGLCLRLTGTGEPETPDCQPPPRTAREDTQGRFSSSAGPPPVSYVSGAVTAGTARLDLRFAHRPPRSLATVPGTAYRGRYRGRVRFYVAALRGVSGPVGQRARDRRGRVLAAEEDPSVAPVIRGPRVLATFRPRHALAGRLIGVLRRVLAPTRRQAERRRPALCLELRETAPGEGSEAASSSCLPAALGRRGVSAAFDRDTGACSSHALHVYGIASPDARSVDVRLSDGRLLRGLDLPLQRRLGVHLHGFIITTGTRAEPRELLVLGRGGHPLTRRAFPRPPRGFGRGCAREFGGIS